MRWWLAEENTDPLWIVDGGCRAYVQTLIILVGVSVLEDHATVHGAGGHALQSLGSPTRQDSRPIL